MGEPARRGQVQPAVWAYLTAHKDEQLWRDDIAAETGFTGEQVSQCVWGLITRKKLPIKVLLRGQSWVYSPHEPETKVVAQPVEPRLFDEIGATRDGTLIIQDVNGTLYRATEL